VFYEMVRFIAMFTRAQHWSLRAEEASEWTGTD